MTVTRRRLSGFDLALVIVGVLMLFASAPEFGPAIRAARADGVGGVFTARDLRCVQHPGHESCVWAGDFASADGRVLRSGVELYGSDRDTLTAGQATPAVDTGRGTRVYGPGGSGEWMFTTLLALAGLAVLTTVARRVRRTGDRGGARGREGQPAAGPPSGTVTVKRLPGSAGL
ncbi:hypothetical protein GCM10010156_09140 [Planobispora rosea]|uniref:Transmembrane protein n=1 Tax=Planobispora rosea TaxID=35762 RepID=A0A8J3S0Z6_PLARO|nr:hypothetical protein [Planobispora rosea]GGS52634.1 hypothetical protein GCM10010156_09140 [Planobispora rosea]GIH83079.1 hypothetical protein Pro02_14870 [Planobispora rosea]